MPPTLMLWEMGLLLAATGGFAGVIAGLLGVGGGIILVPAFFFVFEHLGYGGPGMMQVCLATSLATIIVTSLRSLLAHHRRGAVNWAILRGWSAGIMLGAVLGTAAVAQLRTPALQAIFGTLALVVALYLGLGRAGWRIGATMPGGPARALLAPAMGFLSVLMGIGGGSFGVPLMTLYGQPIHRAVATAAGFGIAIALPAVAGFMFMTVAAPPPLTLGSVNLPAFAIVISMTLITAPWGARLAHAMDPTPLRQVFAVFLAMVALNMLRKVAGW